jgi:hypothetical protein
MVVWSLDWDYSMQNYTAVLVLALMVMVWVIIDEVAEMLMVDLIEYLVHPNNVRVDSNLRHPTTPLAVEFHTCE